jgi:hypothetical protein
VPSCTEVAAWIGGGDSARVVAGLKKVDLQKLRFGTRVEQQD